MSFRDNQVRIHVVSLNLDGGLKRLPLLLHAVLRLHSHDATTPLLPRLLSLLHITLLDSGDELRQLVLVLGADLGESQYGGSLREL